MQQRDEVAPAAGRERVERGPVSSRGAVASPFTSIPAAHAPHHDAGAEAHPPLADVADSGRAPQRGTDVRLLRVEPLDARPQEAADLAHSRETRRPSSGSPTRVCTRHSARSGRRSGRRTRASRSARRARRRAPARASSRPVLDVAQQVGEGEVVELRRRRTAAARPRRARAHALAQPGVAAQPRPRAREHLLALVEPDDLHPPRRTSAAATMPVPVATSSTRCPGCGSTAATIAAPPARILAEAQRRAGAVVVARESGEQLERVALARGQRGFRKHGHLVPQA